MLLGVIAPLVPYEPADAVSYDDALALRPWHT
jgi:hypothetical protein